MNQTPIQTPWRVERISLRQEGSLKLSGHTADVVGVCHHGLYPGRVPNQDAVLVVDGRDFFGAFVADGLGGYKNGALGSHVVLESLELDLRDADLTSVNTGEQLRMMLEAARGRMREARVGDGGTTLTGVIAFDDGVAWCVHCGDSRAQRVSGGQVVALTRDHNKVQEQHVPQWIAQGRSTGELVAHEDGNILRAFVGQKHPPERLDIFLIEPPLIPGDLLFLSSDGLDWVDDTPRARYEDNRETITRLAALTEDELIDALAPEGIRCAGGKGADNLGVLRVRWRGRTSVGP
jgi:serine/threonine protein phosphatase PrpC